MTRILLGLLIASIFALPNPAWSQTGQPWNQIPEKAQKAFDRGLRALERERYKKALTEFTLACDEGAAGGCINAINIAGNDDYGLRNEALVVRMARQACDLDDVDGCIAAGASYKYGLNGVEVNKSEAERYLGKACDDGFGEPDACVEAAPFILRDSQRLDELEGFFATIENACEEDEANPSRSCLMLAGFMMHGIGSTRDREGAKAIYTEYCGQDIGHACHQLGILEHQRYATSQQAKAERKAKAAEFLDQACKLGEVAACMARIELDVGPVSRFASSNWVFGAAARPGIQRAIDTGCEQDHPHACFAKGVLFHLGEFETPNITEAYKYIEKACDLRHYEACAQQAIYMEFGIGTAIDLTRAAELRSLVCFGIDDDERCRQKAYNATDVFRDARWLANIDDGNGQLWSDICKTGPISLCMSVFEGELSESQEQAKLTEMLELAVSYCSEENRLSSLCLFGGLIAANQDSSNDKYRSLTESGFRAPPEIEAQCRSNEYLACIQLINIEGLNDPPNTDRKTDLIQFTISLLRETCDQEDPIACSLGLDVGGARGLTFERRSEEGRAFYYKALQTACYGGVITTCSEYADIVYSNGNFAPVDKIYALEMFETNCRSGLGDCIR